MSLGNDRVLIVDDNRLFREGLSRILKSKRFNVHNEVSRFAEALTALNADGIQPDLLVGDLVPEVPGEVEAMTAILQRYPSVKIVILTDKMSDGWSETLLEQGVVGFLSKNISAEALQHSLALVAIGEAIIPTYVHRSAANSSRPEMVDPGVTLPVALSPRENQILNCLVNGLPNKLIARELTMAEATVKVHLKALLRKLNVQNRTQAAIWAMTKVPAAPHVAAATTTTESAVDNSCERPSRPKVVNIAAGSRSSTVRDVVPGAYLTGGSEWDARKAAGSDAKRIIAGGG